MITKINNNDIICGRRGVALRHPGNIAYRKIVNMNKELYAICLKNEKLNVSKSVVAAMRDIGGRFLEREDGKTSNDLDEYDEDGKPIIWRDIGDKRAIEKTSQALREGQPKLLKKLAASASHSTSIRNTVPSYLLQGRQQLVPMFQHPRALNSLAPTLAAPAPLYLAPVATLPQVQVDSKKSQLHAAQPTTTSSSVFSDIFLLNLLVNRVNSQSREGGKFRIVSEP